MRSYETYSLAYLHFCCFSGRYALYDRNHRFRKDACASWIIAQDNNLSHDPAHSDKIRVRSRISLISLWHAHPDKSGQWAHVAFWNHRFLYALASYQPDHADHASELDHKWSARSLSSAQEYAPDPLAHILSLVVAHAIAFACCIYFGSHLADAIVVWNMLRIFLSTLAFYQDGAAHTSFWAYLRMLLRNALALV